MRILAKMGLCLAIACTSTASMADIFFNGTAIPADDITSITIDPATGDLLLTVGNDWFVQQGTTQPPPPPPPPPPAVTAPEPPADATLWVGMNVSASLVDQFETVTFAWNNVGATRCVTRLGDANWRALSLDPANPGNVDVVMSEAGTDIKFRIFCFDDAGNQVATQQLITVIEATPPPTTEFAACDAPSEVSTGSVDKWVDSIGGMNAEFPTVLTSSFDVFTRRNDFYAIEFVTGTEAYSGGVATVSLSSGVRHVSISECPGNFLVNTPTVCEMRQGIGETLQFTSDTTATNKCVLEPNKRYYLNVTYADIDNRIPGDTSSCGVASCGTRISVNIFQQ